MNGIEYEKLSDIQKRVLKKLLGNYSKEAVSAYDLNESLNTLNSLCAKDYIEYYGHKVIVKSKRGLGSEFSPRTSITFRVFRKRDIRK